MSRVQPSIKIREEAVALEEYARIPIAFLVETMMDPATLVDRAVPVPYLKDYDLYEEDHPIRWPLRFDLASWGFLGAYAGAERVGAPPLHSVLQR